MQKIIASMIVGIATLCGTAMAQEQYPARVITLVTPYAPGGGSDVLTRVLAEALSKELGQKVIVKNTVGGGGVIGSQEVARAKPDGYTLLHHHVGIATSSTLFKDLNFDPIKDFEPVGLFAESPMVIVASKNFAASNVNQLVDYVKKHKKETTVASSGMGSSTHLCAMQFENAIDTQVTMIQYKGAAPATIDVQTGRVDLLCDVTAGGIVEHIKSGSLKAYFVTGDKRLASLPNVPTTTEAGLKGLSEVTAWYGLYAPAGTPQPIIERLSVALQAATRDQAVADRVAKLETVLFDSRQAAPDALRKKLASQVALWKPLLEKALAAAR